MTIRNLDAVFSPQSLVLIGASERDGSLGRILAGNLLSGGFDGDIAGVNPSGGNVLGSIIYPDVESVPFVPDLAIIATPPPTIPRIVDTLARRGTRGAIVISAGFAEMPGAEGKALQQAMLDVARPHLLRIIGPNCLGALVPGIGLNASFTHVTPEPGTLAFVAQSGAVIAAVLDWAVPRNIGFSHMVSLGDMADIDFGDMLDYLANDADTSAVLLYIEAITDARKFMSAARAAARLKPVIVVKAGRTRAAAQAATSHTGALAGSDAVYDAAFRRAGMLRVFSLEDLFDAVETLAHARPPAGNRLIIVSNGGGLGVMATDALVEAGGEMAVLSPQTLDRLNKVLPATWSQGNPVDIIGDADGQRYAAALEIVLREPNADGVLVLNCPTAVASSIEAARAVVDAIGPELEKTLLTCWAGEHQARAAREHFRKQQLPTYDSPEDAVQAFMQMVRYREGQTLLTQTPPSFNETFEPDSDLARRQIDAALSGHRDWLSEHEVETIIEAYDIPTVVHRRARTAAEAAAIARELNTPVAIKIDSPDITHKSDVGGVVLNVTADAAENAAMNMAERVRRAQPDADINGFTIQPMVHRPLASELIVGMVADRQFGPVMLFGHGGTAVEVIDDKALGLPPLNLRLARELIEKTEVYRLLRGYRDVPAVDLDALALTLVKVSQLIIDHPEIAELDINPLLADADGVLALDARIRVEPTTAAPHERLAIRPYPKALQHDITLAQHRLMIRPVMPEDEQPLRDCLAEHEHWRAAIADFRPTNVTRLTQIDYDRQMVLVMATPGIVGRTGIFGLVRLIESPDGTDGEISLFVTDAMVRLGADAELMKDIIEYAKSRNVGVIYASVSNANERLLSLCTELGFGVDAAGSGDSKTMVLSLVSPE